MSLMMVLSGELDGFMLGCRIELFLYAMASLSFMLLVYLYCTKKGYLLSHSLSSMIWWISKSHLDGFLRSACTTGHIVIETSLPSKGSFYGTILSVKPIAVPPSERAEFRITGVNLRRASTRYMTFYGLAISFFVIDLLKIYINHALPVCNTECI